MAAWVASEPGIRVRCVASWSRRQRAVDVACDVVELASMRHAKAERVACKARVAMQAGSLGSGMAVRVTRPRGTRAASAALVTGIYIFVVGSILLLFPSAVFRTIMPRVQLVPNLGVSTLWIRVGAVMCQLFGIYYLADGWSHLRSFALGTVAGRAYLFLAFVGIMIHERNGTAALAAFAVLNLVGAAIMLRALVADGKLLLHYAWLGSKSKRLHDSHQARVVQLACSNQTKKTHDLLSSDTDGKIIFLEAGVRHAEPIRVPAGHGKLLDATCSRTTSGKEFAVCTKSGEYVSVHSHSIGGGISSKQVSPALLRVWAPSAVGAELSPDLRFLVVRMRDASAQLYKLGPGRSNPIEIPAYSAGCYFSARAVWSQDSTRFLLSVVDPKTLRGKLVAYSCTETESVAPVWVFSADSMLSNVRMVGDGSESRVLCTDYRSMLYVVCAESGALLRTVGLKNLIGEHELTCLDVCQSSDRTVVATNKGAFWLKPDGAVAHKIELMPGRCVNRLCELPDGSLVCADLDTGELSRGRIGVSGISWRAPE
ncbi:hypothetical protein FVE85_4861 [Porphyridium purpureum]|uniref:Uncharacterized protein n=1 Tax=Porphyridium purpureum TaxID=35688 RepID=A0A5J4YSP1_PORPP|nr:hypothetical protein FVE85_4861 [Porphyridium purpureum]|eukprot:POR0709..scf236_6